MKKYLLFMAAALMLGGTIQVNAQLIIRNSGHAELGMNPSSIENDTVTTLKLFGEYGDSTAGARITFGEISGAGYNVAIGERGITDTDQLWLHGKNGIYVTKGAGTASTDTLLYFDPSRSTTLNFNCELNAPGLYVQSDERYKEDIEPMENVLSTLEGLEPVSYRLKSHCRNEMQSMTGNPKEMEVLNNYYRALEQECERYGFLAQNVKEIYPELVHTDMNGYMSVDYIGLIPILVQAINELRAELAEVKGEKQDESEASPLQAPAQQSGLDEQPSLSAAKLYQNAPNPWNSETVIRYSLPQSVATADIFIYDMQGAQLKRIPAQGRGENQVVLTANDLRAGMYIYALVADGTLIDSKQMILTK